MGTKRPFDEEFQLFMKHPKHDDGAKSTLFQKSNTFYEASQIDGFPGEAGGPVCKFHVSEGLENGNVNNVTDMAHMESEIGALLPLEKNSVEEDAGTGAVICPPLFHEYFEFNLTRPSPVHSDDIYSLLFNCPPRREIPVGPNHQADVPEYNPNLFKIHHAVNDASYQNVGINVVPMPTLDVLPECGLTEEHGQDCRCLDGGSIRCVQQHVREARAKLREKLGQATFVDLGFNDMGEEVALRFNDEEERLFHEVVYYNPVSRGKNFWEQLSTVFPYRTKKELVSYYFNVFMLQKRATQNRSKILEIDSDDDEWRGDGSMPLGQFGTPGDGDNEFDFVVGPCDGQDDHFDHGDDDNGDDLLSDGDECENDDGGGVLIGGLEADEKDSGVQIGAREAVDKGGEIVSSKEDSSMPFKLQQQYAAPYEKASANEVTGGEEMCLNGSKDEAGIVGFGSSSEYGSEPCVQKFWGSPCSMGLTKGVDFLPTCSMIEEVFGLSKNGNNSS